jgi:uncharacterized sporulation protein YeaH/YhbH (DUF444 family)
MQIIRQRSQRSALPKQQINILQRHLRRLLKHKENNRQRHTDIKRNEQKVELPSNVSQRNRADLSPERSNEPVADAGGESVASGADLHGHDFRHVDPGNGSERAGEDYGDAEEEEDTTNGEAVFFPARVLGVDYSFADESQCDANCAKQEGLAAADAVEEEGYEDEICGVLVFV